MSLSLHTQRPQPATARSVVARPRQAGAIAVCLGEGADVGNWSELQDGFLFSISPVGAIGGKEHGSLGVPPA